MEASLKASEGTEVPMHEVGVCGSVGFVSEEWAWLAGA